MEKIAFSLLCKPFITRLDLPFHFPYHIMFTVDATFQVFNTENSSPFLLSQHIGQFRFILSLPAQLLLQIALSGPLVPLLPLALARVVLWVLSCLLKHVWSLSF